MAGDEKIQQKKIEAKKIRRNFRHSAECFLPFFCRTLEEINIFLAESKKLIVVNKKTVRKKHCIDFFLTSYNS